MSKQYNSNNARKKLVAFKTLTTVLAVNYKIVELALASNFKDFEDDLQFYTATENNINKLITRNLKDYKSAEIIVLTTEQFLKVFSA